MRKTSCTYFQKMVREQLVRLMGHSPDYYDIQKRTKTQRLKWFRKHNQSPIYFEKIAEKLQKIIGDRLKTKLVRGTGYHYTPYLNIWIPTQAGMVTGDLVKHLVGYNLAKAPDPGPYSVPTPMPNKALFKALCEMLDDTCHRTQFHKLTKKQKALALERVSRQYQAKNSA